MRELELIAFAKENQIAVLQNEPMREHTTFRIGGPAKLFATVNEEQLALLIRKAEELYIPYIVVGNGSNLLVSDAGYPGLIIKIADAPVRMLDTCTLEASAGTSLARLAVAAAEAGLTGLEFAHGIPGTVGGAVMMNAGAYDGQISDVLVSSCCYDGAERQFLKLEKDAHLFTYRHSSYMEHPCRVVTSAIFRLQPGNKDAIRAKMSELNSRRREKQPLEFPSAGSTFKRPEGHFAGKLIEDCGLKGYRIGGAQVSEKHAGFVINAGGATCQDVVQLMEYIEQQVYQRFAIRLEREVRVIE
jgi:UDP-N-acetylmuramate dehydrogenase